MLPRPRHSPAAGAQGADQELDPLILRIRRLLAHRGYDREALISPMLKRLMPPKRRSADPVGEAADLRKRILDAGLDRKALTYLNESVETELDFARLRLT